MNKNNNIINTNLDNYFINPSKYIFNSTKIENNTNNFIQNNNNFNPTLFKLVANNNIEQLDNMLKFNSNLNVNEQDKDGDTPLHIAVFLCNIEAINILFNHNADPLIKDKWGQIPLHRICFNIDESENLELLNLFIKIDTDKKLNMFNLQDNYGNTPLHLILKHILKNNVILKDIHNTFIKKIKKRTNLKIQNIDGQSISDLLKNSNIFL